MSRKSDIIAACNVFEKVRSECQTLQKMDEAFYVALGVARDLGRAAQAEKDARWMTSGVQWHATETAKRLRAKVRKAAGETQ